MHDHFADFRGGQFAFRGLVHHAFDLVHDGLQLWRGYRPLFAGLQQTLQNLLPFKTLAPTILFDDHVRNFVDALVSGETAGTFQAFTAAADGVAGTAFAGVDHFIVEMRAERTFHSL